MPLTCDPAALDQAAVSYALTEKQARAARLYLLNQISGLNLTPAQLAANSACFCLTEQASDAAELYLLCAIASKAGA
jgi:hypothetical protein